VKIEVLGMGCSKCEKLEENARSAAASLGIEAEIKHVRDMNIITEYGVTMTPALAVDGKVVVMGKVAGSEEIRKHLQAAK
jgi:small redox-active disulfide protein 2